MNIILPLLGFLIGFISFLGIIGFGISFLITKYRKIQTNRFKKPLVISTVALIISLMIFIVGLNINNTHDTSSNSSISTDKSLSNDDDVVEGSNIDRPISKKQYNEIKIGMGMSDVEKKLGKVSNDNIINITNKTEWNYSSDNDGLAYVSFDKKSNKVVEKSEIGLISDNSSTITDKNGTRNDELLNNNDDKDLVQSDTEDVINSFVDENFNFDTKLDELEINKNMGTKNDNDYIALVHMTIGKTLSAKSGLKWIDNYTNYLASELATKEDKVSELVIFWTMPQFVDKDYNVAKYTLKRNGKKFYFESEWQDKSLLNK